MLILPRWLQYHSIPMWTRFRHYLQFYLLYNSLNQLNTQWSKCVQSIQSIPDTEWCCENMSSKLIQILNGWSVSTTNSSNIQHELWHPCYLSNNKTQFSNALQQHKIGSCFKWRSSVSSYFPKLRYWQHIRTNNRFNQLSEHTITPGIVCECNH